MDEIVCTVKGNPLDYLEYANSLHKNLQFTLETPNGSRDLEFLDLNINLNEDRKISLHWYQNSTDTSIIPNFRSCAPLQNKRNVIFNATSDWQSFNVALKKNQEIWTENQYPTEWFSSIVNETLDKIFTKEKVTEKPPQSEHQLEKVKGLNNREPKPRLGFFVQYRGNIKQNFAKSLKKLYDIQIIFTTRKL